MTKEQLAAKIRKEIRRAEKRGDFEQSYVLHLEYRILMGNRLLTLTGGQSDG